MVGAALGFLGSDDRGTYLHSYIAGVKEALRGGNVGFALKQHQRAWTLEHGLTRVTWTFDPLVRRNAYFNLVKLGATAVAFHPRLLRHDAGHRERRRLERPHPHRVEPRLAAGDRGERQALPRRSTWRRSTASGRRYDCPSVPDGAPEVGIASGAPSSWSRSPTTSSLSATPIRASPAGGGWRSARRSAPPSSEGYQADGITRDGWYVVRRPLDALE